MRYSRSLLISFCILSILVSSVSAKEIPFEVTFVGNYFDYWEENYDAYFINYAGISVCSAANKPRQIELYPFPDWFKSRLNTETFYCGKVPCTTKKWIGWFVFEDQKDILFLVPSFEIKRSTTKYEVNLKQIQLPKDCLFFGFMRSTASDGWLFAITPTAIWRLITEPDGLINYELLIKKKCLSSQTYVLQQMPELYKWVIDVDGDGQDDLLVPSQSSIDIYLQNNDHSLSFSDNIIFPSPLIVDSIYMLDTCTLPGVFASFGPLWLEPVEGNGLPNIVVPDHEQDSLAVYQQTKRGHFIKDKLPKSYGQPRLRQVTKCSLYKNSEDGILINTVYRISQTRIDSIVNWKGQTNCSKALVLTNNPFLVWPVDVDNDGAIELFTYDTPPLKKTLDKATHNISRNLKLMGKFFAWSKESNNWAQISKSFPIEIFASIRPYLDCFSLNEILERQIVVGHDFDGNGFNDIAWTEKNNQLQILLLTKKKDTIEIYREQRIHIPFDIQEIIASDLDGNTIPEILVICNAPTKFGKSTEGCMPVNDYFLVYMDNIN